MASGDPMCPKCGQYVSLHRFPCERMVYNDDLVGPIAIQRLHNYLEAQQISSLVGQSREAEASVQQERIHFLEQEFLRLTEYVTGLEEQITYIQTISTEQVNTIRQLQAMLRVAQLKSNPLIRGSGGYNVY